jgi:selenide,water dikinase
MIIEEPVRLTQYSHGAGCGCKISPKVLDEILQSNFALPDNERLIVGNHSKDDAAVYDLGNGQALISTTDFFMPIVDDPFEFGRIASANAISDVYAMGGVPVLAIAILGWPINTVPSHVARKVIEGARSICLEAGIPLAGGHSIDSPEPIFGLAVNGLVPLSSIKQNNTAKEGDYLLLTKKIGVGILTTAEKKGILEPLHGRLATDQMMQLNKVGALLGKVPTVHAMTDVTGFGLLGHLVEMADGSGLTAEIHLDKVPLITEMLDAYIEQKSIPGGTNRNWDSYGHRISFTDPSATHRGRVLLADPQTSGGLLISVGEAGLKVVQEILHTSGLGAFTQPIGRISKVGEKAVVVH